MVNILDMDVQIIRLIEEAWEDREKLAMLRNPKLD